LALHVVKSHPIYPRSFIFWNLLPEHRSTRGRLLVGPDARRCASLVRLTWRPREQHSFTCRSLITVTTCSYRNLRSQKKSVSVSWPVIDRYVLVHVSIVKAKEKSGHNNAMGAMHCIWTDRYGGPSGAAVPCPRLSSTSTTLLLQELTRCCHVVTTRHSARKSCVIETGRSGRAQKKKVKARKLRTAGCVLDINPAPSYPGDTAGRRGPACKGSHVKWRNTRREMIGSCPL
jgi:hypothetical protein